MIAITHQDIENLYKSLETSFSDINGEDLVLVVRPGKPIDDIAKKVLKHKGIQIIRNEAAPIDSAYLIEKKEYYRLSREKNNE